MAELVPLDRGGGWRKRIREQEEVAVGVMGGFPRRRGPANAWADWIGGNMNGINPAFTSLSDRDWGIIVVLSSSDKIHRDELLSYRTPVLLLDQGPKIDPINTRITTRINDMARSRRELLHMKLQKKFKANKEKEINHNLARWPSQIQELQGQVTELKGRYVRIPAILVTDVELLT